MDTHDFWFENAGTRLYAVEMGSGSPVIFLHGGMANHLVGLRYGAIVAERHRLVAPDLRASGRSVFAGELTWELLADDVAALVHHLGAERAVICGASFGAGVAVKTALRHPGVVASLVLITPAFGGADVGLTPSQHAAMAAMDALGSRAPAEGIEVILPLYDALPEPMRDRARAMAATFDPASVAATTRFMVAGGQPFATAADLAAITAPTLLVPGTDPTHPPEIAELYRTHLPSCVVREGDIAAWATTIADYIG
jgi:pimeloyl-ACP methyl ester carboxylesterase